MFFEHVFTCWTRQRNIRLGKMSPFYIAALLSSAELNDRLIVYKYVFASLLSTTGDALFYSSCEYSENQTLLFIHIIYILLIEATARERVVIAMCCIYYCDASICSITKEKCRFCDSSKLAHTSQTNSLRICFIIRNDTDKRFLIWMEASRYASIRIMILIVYVITTVFITQGNYICLHNYLV